MKNKFFYFKMSVIIFSVIVFLNFLLVWMFPKICVGNTTERFKGKYGKEIIRYEYMVNNQKYEVNRLENVFFINREKLVVPNRYLVIYSDVWPPFSRILAQYPVDSLYNIDSLNRIKIDKSLISFF